MRQCQVLYCKILRDFPSYFPSSLLGKFHINYGHAILCLEAAADFLGTYMRSRRSYVYETGIPDLLYCVSSKGRQCQILYFSSHGLTQALNSTTNLACLLIFQDSPRLIHSREHFTYRAPE